MKRSLKLALLFAGIASVAYADTKISQMPNAGPLGGSELIPAVQNGLNVTTSPNQIKTFVGSGAGTGSVTNVSAGCGLSGGPITSTGTLTASEFHNAQTGTTYSLLTGDCGKFLTQSNSAAAAWTLLAPATAGNGYWFDVQNIGAGGLTLTPAAGTINGSANLSVGTGQGVHIVSDGVNYFANVGTFSGTTVAALFGNQTKNTVLSGPTTGTATTPAFRALVGADLPNPAAASLGGVRSFAAVTHQFLTSISTAGAPGAAQPACADISDFGTACRATTGTTGHTLGFLDTGNTYSGMQVFNGGVAVARRTVAVNTTVLASDQEVCGDVTSGVLTLTLPATPVSGERFIFTDCKRHADTNGLTIAANAGQTIALAATITITGKGSSIGVTWNAQDNDWNVH